MKHDTTTTDEAVAIMAEAAALYVHDANPRSAETVTDDEIATLAASIERCGLLQNLCGVMDEDGERIGVVAGGRRTRAILLLEQEGRGSGPYPVKIAPDLDTALEWSMAENSARANPHAADEIAGYGAMAEKGATVAEIAVANAVSEAHVRKRLKLAGLPADAMTALRENRISLKAAEIFTTADDPERITAALAAMGEGQQFSEHSLRTFLHPKTVGANDRRVVFVTLDAYKEAGGRVTEDLFSDEIVVHDVAKLGEMFEAKLQQAAADATAEGWNWAEISEESWIGWHHIEQEKYARVYPVDGVLSETEAEEYDELEELANGEVITDEGEARLAELEAIMAGDYTEDQKTHAGMILYVDQRGSLEREAGLIRKDDKAAAIEAGVLAKRETYAAEKSDKPKPVHSAKLQDDLNAIRLAATQSALVEKPELVLDLLAFALSPDAGLYSRIMDVRLDGQRNAPEDDEGFNADERILTGLSAAYLDDDRKRADERTKPATRFAAFREEGKKHRNALLAAKLARVLNFESKGGEVFGAVEAELGANLRDIWTPTAENFFKRVNADYLRGIYRDVFACDETDEGYATFAKQKKGDMCGWLEKLFSGDATHAKLFRVTPEVRARVLAWTPKEG